MNDNIFHDKAFWRGFVHGVVRGMVIAYPQAAVWLLAFGLAYGERTALEGAFVAALCGIVVIVLRVEMDRAAW